MTEQTSSPRRDLVRTVARNDLGNAAIGVLEVMLDRNLAEGVIRDIPIIGTVVNLARAGRSVSEALFIRKLTGFLNALQDIPLEERQGLLEEFPDGSEQQEVLGEKLLLALERLDDTQKSALLSRFFAAYIRDEIDYITFTRLARALEKFNLALLPNLRWFYTRQEPQVDTPEEILHELSLAGLVLAELSGSGTIGGSAGYWQSTLGQEFLRIGFDVQV